MIQRRAIECVDQRPLIGLAIQAITYEYNSARSDRPSKAHGNLVVVDKRGKNVCLHSKGPFNYYVTQGGRGSFDFRDKVRQGVNELFFECDVMYPVSWMCVVDLQSLQKVLEHLHYFCYSFSTTPSPPQKNVVICSVDR